MVIASRGSGQWDLKVEVGFNAVAPTILSGLYVVSLTLAWTPALVGK